MTGMWIASSGRETIGMTRTMVKPVPNSEHTTELPHSTAPGEQEKPLSKPTGKRKDQRRSERIAYKNPLIVTWLRHDGVRVTEYAGAVDASVHGCLLKMTTPMHVGAEVEIRHPRTPDHIRGDVIRVGEPNAYGICHVAVNLHTPGLLFWMISNFEEGGEVATPFDTDWENW